MGASTGTRIHLSGVSYRRESASGIRSRPVVGGVGIDIPTSVVDHAIVAGRQDRVLRHGNSNGDVNGSRYLRAQLRLLRRRGIGGNLCRCALVDGGPDLISTGIVKVRARNEPSIT